MSTHNNLSVNDISLDNGGDDYDIQQNFDFLMISAQNGLADFIFINALY